MARCILLAGRRFRLKAETVGIESLNGNRRIAVQIPAGSVVKIEAGPSPFDKSMVVVQWAGRELAMFLEDLETRGELVSVARSRGPERLGASG